MNFYVKVLSLKRFRKEKRISGELPCPVTDLIALYASSFIFSFLFPESPQVVFCCEATHYSYI